MEVLYAPQWPSNILRWHEGLGSIFVDTIEKKVEAFIFAITDPRLDGSDESALG